MTMKRKTPLNGPRALVKPYLEILPDFCSRFSSTFSPDLDEDLPRKDTLTHDSSGRLANHGRENEGRKRKKRVDAVKMLE